MNRIEYFKSFINISGIYKITNHTNNKYYIGSAKNIYNRFHLHYSQLRNNIHFNDHLQSAWNKYGEENFLFEILEECTLDNLIEKEQYYINILSPNYNIRKIAESNRGILWSEKSKQKASRSKIKGPIYQYDLQGNYIREWESCLQVSRTLNYSYSSVNFNVNKKFNKCKDFIFSYEKHENITPYDGSRPLQVRKRYLLKKDKLGNTLKIYKGTKDGSIDLGISPRKINQLIFHKRFDNLDFILEYGNKYL